MRRFSSSDGGGFKSWCAALNVSRRLTSTVAGLVMALGGGDGIHVHHGRDQPFRILQALRSAGRPPGHVTSVTTAPANQQPVDSTDSQSGHHRDGLTCEPKAYNAPPTQPGSTAGGQRRRRGDNG